MDSSYAKLHLKFAALLRLGAGISCITGATRYSALVVLWTLTLFVGPSFAQIYKVTDDEKGVVFTDRPESLGSSGKSQVEELEIPDTNTVAPVAPRPAAPSKPVVRDRVEAERPSVKITSPATETTIAMGPGNFAVSAQASPPLSRGEKLLLTVDGQPVGAAQTSASWFIEGALRGPHDLVVLRTAAGGQTLATSEPVRVYVLRPSILRRR